MKPTLFIIRKNTERYGEDLDVKMPNLLCCYGTILEARELASRLSNWNAGCDYSFYVEGDDED